MDDEFTVVLTDIIGLNEPQRTLMVDQNITDETTLALLDEEAIKDLFSKRPFQTASIITKMRLKALWLWLQEKEDIDAKYSIIDFNEDECKIMLKKMSWKSTSSSHKDRNKKSDVKPPDKFNGKQRNWTTWKAEFEAYLSALKGENGTPLSYIIRDDDDMTEDELNDLEGPAREIYESPLQGTYYERDNYQVFQHLRTQIVGSSAETHIESYGRNAWLCLKTKFEGDDARNAAIAVARKEISSASWERTIKNWNFDDYCNRHTRANNTLSKYGVPVDGPSQVRAFLDGIHNHSMDGVKSNVMFDSETKKDLGKAIIKFKDTISALNLGATGRTNQEDHRRIGSATHGGRYQGHGGQRDGRNKRPYDNGPGHRGGCGGGHHGSYHGGRGYQSCGRFQNSAGCGRSDAPDDGLKLDKNILDQMNSKQRAAFYKGRDSMRANDESPSIRSIAAVGTVAHAHPDDLSVITDGQTNAQMNAASLQFGKESNRFLNNRKQGALTSGQRFISSAKTARPVPQYDYNKRARAEIDSRANTVCAEATFKLLEESSQYCVVNGFHADMPPLQNIPVATVATAFDDPITQATYILIFYEALYFGDSMEHSLISPIQLRHNGLCVDQTPR
jgi:hypothetical protein